MDTWEGDDEDPLSLHKYLYTEVSPINNVDPSGDDDTLDTIYGKQIHKLIGQDFVRQTDGYSNRSINTILGQKVPILGRLMPDLANPFTAEVYEIKPVSDLIEGIAQLTAYIAILRAFDNAKRNWGYGATYTPSQNPLSLGTGSYAFIFPTINGVITYKVINFPSIIAIGLAGAAASISELTLDVGVAELEEATI